MYITIVPPLLPSTPPLLPSTPLYSPLLPSTPLYSPTPFLLPYSLYTPLLPSTPFLLLPSPFYPFLLPSTTPWIVHPKTSWKADLHRHGHSVPETHWTLVWYLWAVQRHHAGSHVTRTRTPEWGLVSGAWGVWGLVWVWGLMWMWGMVSVCCAWLRGR